MLLPQSAPVTIGSQWLAEFSAVTCFAGPFGGYREKNGMEKFRGNGHEARRILEELKNDIFAIIWEDVEGPLFLPSPGIHAEER
jgi:hypothetical protein